MPKLYAASINGEARELSDPEVQAFVERDHDFPPGSNYEALKVFHGKIHRFDLHWDRIQKSSQITGLELPHTREQVEGWCTDQIARVRQDAFLILIAFTPDQTAVISYELNIDVMDPDYSYKAITYEVERPKPKAKSLEARKVANAALEAAQVADTQEALLLRKNDDGELIVTEGSVTNMWWQIGKTLYTNLDLALEGTTQRLILMLAKKAGIEIVTTSTLKAKDLPSVDGLAVTSVRAGFRRVSEVDGQFINDGGQFTPEMRQLFDLLVTDIKNECPSPTA